jgi:hypothetical protein
MGSNVKRTDGKSSSDTNKDSTNHKTGEPALGWWKGLQKGRNHGDHATNTHAIPAAQIISLGHACQPLLSGVHPYQRFLQ